MGSLQERQVLLNTVQSLTTWFLPTMLSYLVSPRDMPASASISPVSQVRPTIPTFFFMWVPGIKFRSSCVDNSPLPTESQNVLFLQGEKYPLEQDSRIPGQCESYLRVCLKQAILITS